MEAILSKIFQILVLIAGIIGLNFIIVVLLKLIYDFVSEIIDDILDIFRR